MCTVQYVYCTHLALSVEHFGLVCVDETKTDAVGKEPRTKKTPSKRGPRILGFLGKEIGRVKTRRNSYSDCTRVLSVLTSTFKLLRDVLYGCFYWTVYFRYKSVDVCGAEGVPDRWLACDLVMSCMDFVCPRPSFSTFLL